MTDQELIQALRYCVITDDGCAKCPAHGEPNCSLYVEHGYIADRLEALLDELEKAESQIQKEICKRVAVEKENERLKFDKAMNTSAKRLSVEDLEHMNCPVWFKYSDCEAVAGFWCLCNMGYIMTPSGRDFNVRDIPDWQFYRNPPRTEG